VLIMTAIIEATVGKYLVQATAKRFGTAVVERWTRYRAEQFFEGFVETCGIDMASETDRSETVLDEILADEKKTEALFDAYRKVCFTQSKDLGPRIIGLLTGKLVHEGRVATYDEECVFSAAERLSDGEFLEFMKEYHEHRTKAQGVSDKSVEHHMIGETVCVRWCEQKDSDFMESSYEIGPFPWDEAFGRWATNLHQCGLMSAQIQQRVKKHGVRKLDGQTSSTAVVTTVSFARGCVLLYSILARGLRRVPRIGQ
jgi:hypothetical protein